MAASRLEEAKLRYRTIGGGKTVTGQLPAPGSRIAEGTEIIIYLGAAPSEDLETLPDLKGMSYHEARDTLSYYGLYISSLSPVTDPDKQTVSSQSLPAGTKTAHGAVIEVALVSRDDAMLGIY